MDIWGCIGQQFIPVEKAGLEVAFVRGGTLYYSILVL